MGFTGRAQRPDPTAIVEDGGGRKKGPSVEGALGEALLLQVAGVVEADEDGAVAAHVEDADGRQVVAQAAELGDGQP
jgi:hypothetical protein